nr:protein suppressor of K(+) transport growth defect 1 [Ipomoea batatas]
MTRGGRAGSTRGRGRGAPPLVEPIVAPPPTVVSPPVQSPASIGSPADLPIPSPSNSTAPPTSSSVAGSSIGCDLTIIHVEDGRPDVKAKSEQQRKNRMSEVEGPGTGCSKHTGGSRSAIEHYHKLREELQKEPNLFECFAQMHKKKDGIFVDERKENCCKYNEEVQARHDIATQEAEDSTESPNINMSQLYVDVVGGAKKQRIYGLGTKRSSFINGNSCGSSATSQLHQDAMKDMMNQQLETMRQAENSVNSNDENLGDD